MDSAIHPWTHTYEKLGEDWQTLPTIPELTLSGYIARHAKNYANREALVYAGAGINYATLDEQANRMAQWLKNQGCQAGDVLGIQLPNIPQYVIALVAAARLGMTITSISPLLTAPEVMHQANDAGVNVLLTLDALYDGAVAPVIEATPSLKQILVTRATDFPGKAPTSPFSAEASIPVEDMLAAIAGTRDGPIKEAGHMDVVLYLQYTGGTTGPSKGAQLTSRNMFLNNAQGDAFWNYREGEEIVASAFPLFHIGGAAVLFNAMRTAATFILVPDPRNLDQFCAEVTQRPPSVMAAVPALYQMLLAHEPFRALDFSQLRLALCGAAPFAESDIEKLSALIGPGKFCEVYGMTETSPLQTLNPANALKPGFAGIPLPGTDLRIVDTDDGTRQMPIGEPGEIIVAGPQVMKGYLNLPEASAHALREHDGKIWMHTGDIGFIDEDGYVKVCDRSKDMLIVGGYKVFSVEIENKLLSLPEIAMCAVVGRADEKRPGNEVVQLFVQPVVSAEDEQKLKGRITEFCRTNMAPYKVPKEIFIVDAIPLTSVGKIDKKALRA